MFISEALKWAFDERPKALFTHKIDTTEGEAIGCLIDRPHKGSSDFAQREFKLLCGMWNEPAILCRAFNLEDDGLFGAYALCRDKRGALAFADMAIVEVVTSREGRAMRKRTFYKCKCKFPRTREQIEAYRDENQDRGFLWAGAEYAANPAAIANMFHTMKENYKTELEAIRQKLGSPKPLPPLHITYLKNGAVKIQREGDHVEYYTEAPNAESNT